MKKDLKEAGKNIARLLLQIGAVKISIKEPYQWASGWHSPIYCDNRMTLSFPHIRTYIKETLSRLILEKFSEVEAIVGVATAGIPQGTLVADNLELPFLYVRSKSKGHGMKNLIEGKIIEGQRAVVVEDLVSTGKSSLQAIEAAKKEGLEVIGLVAIFSYGFEIAKKNLTKEGIEYYSLSNYHYLLDEAKKLNKIKEDQMVSLKAWSVDPENWHP